MKRAPLLLVPLLLAPGVARGEHDLRELSMEELLEIDIEVASSTPEDALSTPSTVSVIDRATIELYGFTSIAEALEALAGVTIHRTFEMRDIPVIRGVLQDHFADKVLILIDGVPMWMATTGYGSINTIDIDAVERIEVLKGPASVLYGTNAYAGAINIVLRTQAGDGATSRGRAHGRVGTLQHLSGGGSFSEMLGPVRLFVAASASSEEGVDYPFTDERGEAGHLDDFGEGASFLAQATCSTGCGGAHRLLLHAFNRRESFLGAVPDYQRGAGNPQLRYGYLAHYNWTLEVGRGVDLVVDSTFDWQRRDTSRIEDDSVRTESIGYRARAGLGVRLRPLPGIVVELRAENGYRRSLRHADYSTETLAVLNENNMTGQHVHEPAVLAQLQLRGEQLPGRLPISLLVGARYTYNTDAGDNLSTRGTLVFRLAERSSVKLVAGQSFRAPTLFELYFETPFATQSIFRNPDLGPENSDSLELSFQQAVGDFYLQVLGYRARYHNKIFLVRRDPDDAEDLSLVYANGDQFAAWGAELEVRYQTPALSAFASYALVHGDDGDEVAGNDHYNFKYVPAHLGSAGLSKKLGPLSASTLVHVVGERHGPNASLSATASWDLVLKYRSDSGTVHGLVGRNLLDEQVLVPDYSRRGVNAYRSGYGRRILYTISRDF